MGKTIDKDAIISDLQNQVRALNDCIIEGERERKRIEERADENYKNGRAWKDAVDNAERARKDSLAKERAAVDAQMYAEKRLSFAEGYIAALKGEPYEKSALRGEGW